MQETQSEKQNIIKAFPFTDSQITEMKNKPYPSKLWSDAFLFYNSDKNNNKVSMACRSCFNKVMDYLLSKKPMQ